PPQPKRAAEDTAPPPRAHVRAPFDRGARECFSWLAALARRHEHRTMRRLSLLLCFAIAAGVAHAQTQTDWNAPFPPHRVMDNLYSVGTAQLGSFLITTPAGNILINSDFESTVPFLEKNVQTLGFKFTDIKILLGSHAHGDHMEGDALVKQLTGATVMAM